MIVNGGSENIVWCYMANMTDAELMTYINHVVEACRSHDEVYVLLIIGPGAFPNASQRRIIAQMIREHEVVAQHMRANAYLTPDLGTMTRGIITAIGWLVRKPWNEAVHATLSDSLAWLALEGASQEAVAVVETDIRAARSSQLPFAALGLPAYGDGTTGASGA